VRSRSRGLAQPAVHPWSLRSSATDEARGPCPRNVAPERVGRVGPFSSAHGTRDDRGSRSRRDVSRRGAVDRPSRGWLRRGTGPSAPASGRSPQGSAGGRHVLLRPPRPLTAAASPDFEVRVDLVTGRLTMTGRLDVRTTRLLYDAVSALLTAQHPSWTGDVGQLTDIDHAGLRGLLSAYCRHCGTAVGSPCTASRRSSSAR
jgi:hypothetical protein